MQIRELDGITERKVKQFEEKGIETIEDLLKLVPKDYFDCRQPTKLTTDLQNELVCVIATLNSELSSIGKDKNILRYFLVDDIGNKITVLWFNQMFMKNKLFYLNKGDKIIIFGKASYSPEYKNYTITNPIIFSRNIEKHQKIIPIYKKISGMSEEYYKDCIDVCLKKVNARDYLTQSMRDEFNLCEYNNDFFRMIHQPNDMYEVNATKRRLIFDDLFYFASKLFKEQHETEVSNFIIKNTDVTKSIISSLPYKLTDDQLSTVSKIINNAKTGKRVNALVQGDVGCGKTIVSFLSMFAFAENGYQSALMAPTQVLAKQHYDELNKMAEKQGFKVAYMHSGMRAKEKREVLKGIENGYYSFIVGTHSIISPSVIYNNLALAITDEEHKFGVEQRDALIEKTSSGVHTITMSATPIPRTLAITLYGDSKEVFTIAQMPNGRKPIKTGIMSDDIKTCTFMKKEIENGRQCYVVCPLIKDSENEKLENVESVESVYEKINDFFAADSNIKIEMLTGKHSATEVENIIEKFSKNEVQILISTTVIEVGVNVPNSSVIVIRNAERFGLAQLHQLRGRVGRGSYQSYCILCSEDRENQRLLAMCQSNNGFEIAEADLKQRGTGDLIGTKQSGDNKYVKLMLSYPKFFLKVKERVKYIIQESNMLRK